MSAINILIDGILSGPMLKFCVNIIGWMMSSNSCSDAFIVSCVSCIPCLWNCVSGLEKKKPGTVALFVVSQVAAMALMTIGFLGVCGQIPAIGMGGSIAMFASGVILGLPLLVWSSIDCRKDFTLASCLRSL